MEETYYKKNKAKILEQRKIYYEKIKENKKEYYEKNKDKISEQRKEYYKENKDEIIEKIKDYYQENKEEILKYQKEYQKKYRDENKEEIIKYRKKCYENNKEKWKNYYEENKHKITEYHKKYRLENKDKINKQRKCKDCQLFYVMKKNNYLCTYCNPNKTKRSKTKEENIKQLLINNNFDFIHDKMVINDCCLKYRPDFLFDCISYYLILEVDENAHSQYDNDCEIIRMNNIIISLGLPCKFIRYNPDNKNFTKKEKEDKLLQIFFLTKGVIYY